MTIMELPSGSKGGGTDQPYRAYITVISPIGLILLGFAGYGGWLR
jgi:hypothetical protein